MMILSAASSSISLTTPASPGEELARNTKLDNIKRWDVGISIYLFIYPVPICISLTDSTIQGRRGGGGGCQGGMQHRL